MAAFVPSLARRKEPVGGPVHRANKRPPNPTAQPAPSRGASPAEGTIIAARKLPRSRAFGFSFLLSLSFGVNQSNIESDAFLVFL